MAPHSGRPGTASGQPAPKAEKQYKVSLFGESSVGKSSIFRRFDEGVFKGNLMSTVGLDCRNCLISVDGIGIGLNIWDTAGQERFRTLTRQHFRGAKGLFLIYDVGNQDSFDKLSGWLHSIKEHGLSPEKEIVFIIGNKIDLPEDRWSVDVEKAEEFAIQHNCRHFLTSAKTGKGINKIFLEMAVALKDAFGPHHVNGDCATKVEIVLPARRPSFQATESFPLGADDFQTRQVSCCKTS